MNEVRILLVCMEGASLNAYIKELDSLGVAYDVVPSFGDTYKHKKTKYNGFLFDVATVVRAKPKEKIEANRFVERFPVLRINYLLSGNVIRGIPIGQFSGESNELVYFITHVCANFPARSLRGSKSSSRVLNVLLRRELGPDKIRIEKSVTFDISEEGGFFFSVKRWEEGEPLSVVVKELADMTPILSVVQRVQIWGKTDKIPGIEVKFLTMTEAQADQIEELLLFNKDIK
ncbi:hypothetical protein [Maridesulfovibrio frigidus]|uniref:hypothetical protein n=1 Tax=Maridesulfovibrio frigidus TaxID=340956 RepID=UPI0004E19790|nr:hypothetical protein [Maridesulfovibrio frigidus]